MNRVEGPLADGGPAVEVFVTGPFAVRGPGGEDLTPGPQKSRAILALLALSPDQRRTRQWIVDRLWSDRAPEQASGSLRQALVDLRKALGDHAGAVEAGREWIALRPGAVAIREATLPGAEFLEGIAIRDPHFRTWREAQRVSRHPVAETPQPQSSSPSSASAPEEGGDPLIMIGWGTSGTQGSASGVVAEIIASRIAGMLAEQVPAATMTLSHDQLLPAGNPDIDVTCNVIEDDGIALALIKVTHFPTGRVLFARDFRLMGPAPALVGSEAIDRAVFEAAEKAAGGIPHVMGARRAVTQSTAMGQLALHKMFSFDEGQLAEADRLLARAYDLHESSVYLAWRGLLQMIRSIEFPNGGGFELREMAESLTRYATERGGGNATVNALASQTRAMMFGDTGGALHFAERALDSGATNPFALQAMGVARMLAGENEDAYQLSSRARNYAAKSAFRHWWDAHHATICVATGRKDEAIATAESALRSVASLRPAYRYLIALYADRGEFDKALGMKARLEALEPGFSLDRMLNDADYPVRTLRRAGLIGAVRKLL